MKQKIVTETRDLDSSASTSLNHLQRSRWISVRSRQSIITDILTSLTRKRFSAFVSISHIESSYGELNLVARSIENRLLVRGYQDEAVRFPDDCWIPRSVHRPLTPMADDAWAKKVVVHGFNLRGQPLHFCHLAGYRCRDKKASLYHREQINTERRDDAVY